MVSLPYIYSAYLPTPKISCRNLHNARKVSARIRHKYTRTRYFLILNWQFFLPFLHVQLVKTLPFIYLKTQKRGPIRPSLSV